ncbi:hypothetical protein D6856_09900 [Butyrivibrio sp. XB500-5]|uniref:hypothetical protein n=1 Tax=Butyrivibrio sp. XB500-5 TaxID=2364880 RepID=UPI000EAA7693|nr:hypothetical protein [Butyrivibrio sp. XB500-5]RKM59521.1 hypothetical protein D6856_09900 [Butyrivibrio sp. XB500-5]
MIIYIIGAVLIFIAGVVVGAFFMGRQYQEHCKFIERNAERFVGIYGVTLRWIRLQQEGKKLSDYFEKNNYKTVAIYGMSEVGYAILDELERNGISVKYCIDRNADNIFARVKMYRPDEELPQVDAVIVAVVQYYNEINETLKSKMNCPIISASDVVWEA